MVLCRYTCDPATRRIAVFYGSFSVADDLAWGAMWLYKATGQQSWLDTVRTGVGYGRVGSRKHHTFVNMLHTEFCVLGILRVQAGVYVGLRLSAWVPMLFHLCMHTGVLPEHAFALASRIAYMADSTLRAPCPPAHEHVSHPPSFQEA